MTRLVPGICVALLLAWPLRAQDFNPRTATCETWAQGTAQARASHFGWVMDYIAHHDQEPDRDYYAGQIDLTDRVDAAEVTAWLDNYCAAHRPDTLEQAAAALVSDLGIRWAASHGKQP